ncbi:MAG: hypothetical protein JWO59_2794 [Chloroflexi bacterium]|nr:hypothetical protein [Chloroflexota bacterium]
MEILDTSYHKRRFAARMQDPEFRREYEAARQQIDQVDAAARSMARRNAQRLPPRSMPR